MIELTTFFHVFETGLQHNNKNYKSNFKKKKAIDVIKTKYPIKLYYLRQSDQLTVLYSTACKNLTIIKKVTGGGEHTIQYTDDVF